MSLVDRSDWQERKITFNQFPSSIISTSHPYKACSRFAAATIPANTPLGVAIRSAGLPCSTRLPPLRTSSESTSRTV